MSRLKYTIRPVEKAIHIPEDIVAKVNLLLYSEVEARVPHGAWARYVTALIRQDLERLLK